MLPELCLSAHEIGDFAPGQPLYAPADWRVKTQWLGGDYLARAVEFEDDWRVIVARSQARRDAPLLRIDLSHLAVTDDLIVNQIRTGEFEGRLAFDANGRLVAARDQIDSTLILSRFGETFWKTREDEKFLFAWMGVDSNHRFDEKWRRQTDDAQIERDIGQMLADSTSDCAFAWTWLHRSARQRNALIYFVGRGSLDEVEALVRAVCVSGAHESQGANWRLLLNIGIGAGTEFYPSGATEIARHSYLRNDDDARPLAPNQVRLVELILRHFELWRNWRAQTYTIVQELWRDDSCHWLILFAAPSMHDVLEARLLLRDFLRDQVSAGEMRELLRESRR